MPEPLDYQRPAPPSPPGGLTAIAIFLPTSLVGLLGAIVVVDGIEFAVGGRRGDGGMSVLLCYATLLNSMLIVFSGRLFRLDRGASVALVGLAISIPLLPFTLCKRLRRGR